MRNLFILIALTCTGMLAACGGGGSSSNTPATASTGSCAGGSNCALPSTVAVVPPQN